MKKSDTAQNSPPKQSANVIIIIVKCEFKFRKQWRVRHYHCMPIALVIYTNCSRLIHERIDICHNIQFNS